MGFDTKDSKSGRVENQGLQDDLKAIQARGWAQWLAVGLTIASCLLYVGLFWQMTKYQALVAETVTELPLSIRIMLNISQPFLIVFIIVSISLWILWHLSMKKTGSRYMLLLVLIVSNFLVAATLLGISFVKIN